MSERAPGQIIAVVLLICAVAISAALFIVRPQAGEARNAILVLNWFLWLLFVAVYPVSVLQSGK